MFHHVVDPATVLLRFQVEDALQGETLERAVLDLRPDLVVEDVELGKQAAVCDVVEASRGDALVGVLDEELHHLHTLHLAAVNVHEVDLVLPAFGQILLRHLADGVGLEYHVELVVGRAVPQDREIRTHHHTVHKAFFLVLDAEHLHGFGFCELHKVGLHGRCIDQRDAEHPLLISVHHGLEDRNAVYCNDCHSYGEIYFCGKL